MIWWQLVLDGVVFGLLIIGGVAFVVHRAMITEAVGQETPSKSVRLWIRARSSSVAKAKPVISVT